MPFEAFEPAKTGGFGPVKGGFEPFEPESIKMHTMDEWEPVRDYYKKFPAAELQKVHGTSDIEAIIEKTKKDVAGSKIAMKSLAQGFTGANLVPPGKANLPLEILGGVGSYMVPFGKGVSTAVKFAVIPAAKEIIRQSTTPGEKLNIFQRPGKVATAGTVGYFTGKFFDQAGVLKTVLSRVLTRGAVMGAAGAAEGVVQPLISGQEVNLPDVAVSGGMNFVIGTILGGAVEIPALRSAVWSEANRIAKVNKAPAPVDYAEAKTLVKSIMQNPEELSPVFRDAVYKQKYNAALKEIKQKYQPGIGELFPLRKTTAEVLTDRVVQQRYNTFDSLAGKEAIRLRQGAETISKQTGRPVEEVLNELRISQKGSLTEVLTRDPIYRDLVAKGADPVDIYMAVTEAEKLKVPPGIQEAIPTKQGKAPLTDYFKPSRKVSALPAIQEQAGISKGLVYVNEGTGTRTIEIPGYSGWVREESSRILNDATKTLELKDEKGKDKGFNQLPIALQAEANAELQKALMQEGVTDEQKQALAKNILQDKLQANNIYFVGSEKPISGDTPVFSALLGRSLPIKELVDKLKHGVEYTLNGMNVRESISPDKWAIHVGQLEFQRPGLSDKLRAMIKQMYDESSIPEATPLPIKTEAPLKETVKTVMEDIQKPSVFKDKGVYVPGKGGLFGDEIANELTSRGINVAGPGEHWNIVDNLFGNFKEDASKVYANPVKFTGLNGDIVTVEYDKDGYLKQQGIVDETKQYNDIYDAVTEMRNKLGDKEISIPELGYKGKASEFLGERIQPTMPEVSQEEDLMQAELQDLTSGVKDGIVSTSVVRPAFFAKDLSETSADLDLINQYYQLTQEWKSAIEASNVTANYDAKIRELQNRLNARRKIEDKISGKITYAPKYSSENTFKKITQLEVEKQKVLQGMKLTKEDLEKINAIYNEEAQALLEKMNPAVRELVQKTSTERIQDLLTKLQQNLWISKAAKDKVQAEDEENQTDYDIDNASEIEADQLVDVDDPAPVLDIPLEEGEELVTEYNETLNETTVSMVAVSGQNIENTVGAPIFLQGEYAFATDPDRKNEVKLVNKEQSVWVSKANFRELLRNSNFVRIIQKRLSDRRGRIINPVTVVQEMARNFYNMFKPLKHKPYDVNKEFKQTYPLKRLLESMQFIGDADKFFDHLAATFPELKTLLKGPQYPKETITDVMTDKRFRVVAEFMGKTTLKDVVSIMYNKAMESVAKELPEARRGQIEKAARDRMQFITWLQFRAGEEIRVPFNKNLKFPGLLFFERSELGTRGPYKPSGNPVTPNGEMQAVVIDLLKAYKYLGIPYSKADVDQWVKERPSLAFFRLLAHPKLGGDDTFQRAVVWAKTEADNPLLMDQIAAGVYTHSDMFGMWLRGFQRRPWTKEEIQKAGGDPTRISVGSTDVQAQKYRTGSEFAWQSERQGLKPVDDWITSERTYIRDSLLLLAQVRLINRFKMLRNPNPVKLVGFEDNAEVNKYVQLMKVIDYEVSPVVKKLSELTKLTPNDIFMKMGYIQGHNLPGFALYLKGTGDRFQPPYVIRDLYDVFAHTYAAKSGPLSTFFNIANTLTYFPRMVLTIAPFDSPSRYLTPEFVRKPISVITTAADMFSKGMIGGPIIGYKILKGEYDPLDFYTTEKFENLPKFIANGFPRHMIDVMKSQYDIEKMQDIIPELNTSWDNVKEWAISLGGFNAAVFDRIVIPKLYDLCNAQYLKLKSQNYDDDTAARLATLKTTNQSYLLDPAMWGTEGAAWATLLFSKGLTPGFIRLLMLGLHPLITAKPWRTPGKRVARYAFGYKGKPPMSWFNAFTLGDIGERDLDKLGMETLKTIFKFLLMWNLLANMMQWAMSWSDPRSEEDKNPLSMWRFMFNNDWRHKFQPKLPYKDINSRDAYLDMQYLVEAGQVGDIMLNAAGKLLQKDERWGKEPMDIMRNKLSIGVSLLITWLTKRDPRTGKLIVTPGASKDVQRKQFNDWISQDIRPFQMRREAPLTDKMYNDFFKTSEWFGIARKPGDISEEGYSDQEVQDLKQDIANYEALRTFERNELENMPPDELLNASSDFITGDTIQEEWTQKNYPVTKMIQDNQRAIAIMDMLKSGKKKSGFEPIK